MKKFLPLVIFVAIHSASQAQTFTNKEWVQTAGTPDALNLVSSALFPDGSVVIVGNTSTQLGAKDILVTKYTADGGTEWQQTFGGTAGANDYGIAVRVDANGATIVTGTVVNVGTAEDIAVAKYDASGALEWNASWDGNGLLDFPAALAVDGAGDIYVAGASTSTTTATDYAVLKYSASGSLVWNSAYNYTTNLQDYATSLILNGSGDPVVTGASAASATAWDYATVIFDQSSGTQTAVNRIGFPGIGIDEPSAIAKDASGNIIVVGTADSNGNKNIRTVKFSPSLTLLWSRSFDGSGMEDKGLSVGVNGSGDVFVAGYTEKSPGITDFITLKYDAYGILLWDRNYQSKDGSAKASQLVVTPANGCKVVGTVDDGGDPQARAIGYTPDGDLEWESSYNSPGNDGATSILLDGDAVCVSGISQDNIQPGVNNYATVRYTVYQDRNPYHLNSAGQPDYVDREVIIRFRPQWVNQAFVSNRDLQYAPLQKVVPPVVVSEMSSALGVDLSEHEITVMKVHRWMTPADSISISRLGDTVRMDKHWCSFVVTLPQTVAVVQAALALSQLSGMILYAEPNYLANAASVPNDPLLPTYQADLIPNATYPNASINLDSAWNISTGDTSIRVGVYDSPIWWRNPDFGSGISFAASKIKGGFDYITGVSAENTFPTYSHGTACAGIIGALRNNGKGVAGIAGGDAATGNKGVSLYSVGIFSSASNRASTATIAEAIVYGASSSGYGLHIQNHSYQLSTPTHELQADINSAVSNQCILVAARGNYGDEGPHWPAAFRDDLIISVGSSGTDGGLRLSMVAGRQPPTATIWMLLLPA